MELQLSNRVFGWRSCLQVGLRAEGLSEDLQVEAAGMAVGGD